MIRRENKTLLFTLATTLTGFALFGNPSCGSSGGGSTVNTGACASCAKPLCQSDDATCSSTAGCQAVLSCLLACHSGDTTCQTNCSNSVSSAAFDAASVYVACAIVECPGPCLPPATGTGGTSGGGSGTGGAPAPHCTGTPSVTCAQCAPGASCSCNQILGCHLGAGGPCTGSPPACSTFIGADDCTLDGCTFNFSSAACTGTPNPCSTSTTMNDCTQRSWCTWAAATDCEGTPLVCSQLAVSECSGTPGCVQSN